MKNKATYGKSTLLVSNWKRTLWIFSVLVCFGFSASAGNIAGEKSSSSSSLSNHADEDPSYILSKAERKDFGWASLNLLELESEDDDDEDDHEQAQKFSASGFGYLQSSGSKFFNHFGSPVKLFVLFHCWKSFLG